MLITHTISKMSNKGMKYQRTSQLKSRKEYEDIKEANKKALDKILAKPNWMEELGRKYYGDNWMITLDGNHPDRTKRKKELSQNTKQRKNGDDVPFVVRASQRPIYKLDKDNNILEKYESANHWCKVNNEPIKKAQSLVKACKGFANTAYGCIWVFQDEYKK